MTKPEEVKRGETPWEMEITLKTSNTLLWSGTAKAVIPEGSQHAGASMSVYADGADPKEVIDALFAQLEAYGSESRGKGDDS